MKANPGISRRNFLRACGGTGAGLVTGLHRRVLKAAARAAGGKAAIGNIHVGLDLGTSKVCAAVAERRSDGSIRILDIGEAPSRASKWGIHDPEGTRCSVREALVNAEVNSDVIIGGIVLGLKAGPQGRLRDARALIDFLHDREEDWPFIEAFNETPQPGNDVRRCMDFIDEQEKALLLDLHGERLLAHGPYPPFVTLGRGVDVGAPLCRGAATERRDYIESTAWRPITQIEKLAPYAGFWNDGPLVEVAQAVIAPVATAEAVLSREDKDRGALVIDMGAGTTQFTVFADGLVHSDCIQVGGRYLAIDVPSALVFRLERLERLSSKHHSAEAGKCCAAGRVGAARKKPRDSSLESFDSMRWMHTFELIKARLELMGVRLDSLRAGVHLTGGYSVFPDMPDFANWILGISVQIGRVKGVSGSAKLLNDPRYSCAIGMTKLAHGGQIE